MSFHPRAIWSFCISSYRIWNCCVSSFGILTFWAMLACEAIDLGGNVATTNASRADASVSLHDTSAPSREASTPRDESERSVDAVPDESTRVPDASAGGPDTLDHAASTDTGVVATSNPDAGQHSDSPDSSDSLERSDSLGRSDSPDITQTEASTSPSVSLDAAAERSPRDASTCDAQHFVEGSVRSVRGLPVANVELSLTDESGNIAARAPSDEDGNYRIGPVCSGTYSVVPAFAGLAFCLPSVDVELGQLGHEDAREDFTASDSGCETPGVVRAVQAYIFDPDVATVDGGVERLSVALGVPAPELQLERLARYLEMSTNGHVHFEVTSERIAEFPPNVDGTRFTQDSYFECAVGESCGGVPADDLEITQALNACEPIDTGVADEVWLLGAPNFGFYPRFELVPTCRRSADIVPMTYGLGLERLLGDFQWRSQNGLQTTFGAIAPDVPVTPLDVFTHDAYSGSEGAKAAGCGSSVFAPNAKEFGVFDDPRTVSAYCDAFFDYPPTPDPLVATGTLSCADWGCTELGFRRYWFAHLPRAAGRDAEGRMADFWRYITSPDDRTSTTGIICSSSLGSGWCDKLVDGDFGTCNDGEWASTNRGTTWVDVYLGEEVSSVSLYDRACPEQVLSGHIEFSDGSDTVYFGALPDEGLEPTRVEFTPRVVRSLRIVIDEATGAYPGLSELLIE